MAIMEPDWARDAGDCGRCKCQSSDECPKQDATEEEPIKVPLPEARVTHEICVDKITHQRLITGGGSWVTDFSAKDIQAGDFVILQFSTLGGPYYGNQEPFAAGVAAHVAHAENHAAIKRGHIIVTLKDLLPIRAATPDEGSTNDEDVD